MSVAVCRSLKPTLRQNFSMYTNSWNSGNHFLAFWMMDFRNDTSSWCAVSLSAISLRCLTCNSISWRLCSSCCRCICCCNNLMLSSRAATSLCRVRLLASSSFNLPSFNLPPPKREPTFATNAAFASVLAASSFSDLTSGLTSSSCCSACCYSVCNCCTLASSSPVCHFKSR